MSGNFSSSNNRNKVMLGFIVRKCIMDIGHTPTADEFAAWANDQEENGHRYSLFGKPISLSTAKVMIRHPERLVSVRSESIVKSSKVHTR
jgi:hypothetical protein